MTSWRAPGRPTVSTMIYCANADEVIAFAKAVFGASLKRKPLRRQDGTFWNAELTIGDSMIMIAEAEANGPSLAGFVYVYTEDADAIYQKALDAGAQPMVPLEDQFYGDRAGGVQDPQGNIWWIATHQRALDDDALVAAARAFEAAKAGAQQ
ncbi:MAG: VOC family protein [Pseudomonadota bacterium]